jgi:hypothetical protein
MTYLFASPAAPTRWRQTTAQLMQQANTTKLNGTAAPAGIALHQFTELIIDRVDAELTDLHRFTTILTKQVRQALGDADRFSSIQSLVTDPERIATHDGRTASELCGENWTHIQSASDARARAAIDGAHRFGDDTVMLLAELRTAESERPWWGTNEWDQRVDDWSGTVRFAHKLKRQVRLAPELIADDLLFEIIGG